MKRMQQHTVGIAALLLMGLAAHATPIQYGVLIDNLWQWNEAEAIADPNIFVSEHGIPGGGEESDIATRINSAFSSSFTSSQIAKTEDDDLEPYGTTAPDDSLFFVPEGYQYLYVRYDGVNAGYVVIKLNGSSALVPSTSYSLWEADVTVPYEAGKFDVTHWAVAGRVPDGGLTILLLGAAMAGLGFANRKLRKA